jgi:hypothetical protein
MLGEKKYLYYPKRSTHTKKFATDERCNDSSEVWRLNQKLVADSRLLSEVSVGKKLYFSRPSGSSIDSYGLKSWYKFVVDGESLWSISERLQNLTFLANLSHLGTAIEHEADDTRFPIKG